MKAKVLNLDNKASGEIDLSDAIFGLEPRADLIQRVVVWQLAKRRSGNHKAKIISEVSGTTKKPWAQKGTGHARQGSLRSAAISATSDPRPPEPAPASKRVRRRRPPDLPRMPHPL